MWLLPAGLITLALLVRPTLAFTQAPPPGLEPPPKRAHAVRLQGAAPRVDGLLDDAAWRQAEFFSDFIAKEPVEGAVPSESTKVGILYDDEAIYIGARMYSRDPSAIQRNVSRRDQGSSQSEHIWFSFDSYLDRRTAYSFGVTAAGVRFDFYHPTDNEYNLDGSFDPVWDGKAHLDSLGWTCELRIPFSQLRFRRQNEQVWGFNVDRWIPSKFEDIFWKPVPKNVTGWSSRMGELVGISGIRPSRRLELLPYVAGGATISSTSDPNNPFNPTGRTSDLRAGGDLKAGIGPNLTVDATVNPDFGQVDADPAVVNLSVFETTFDERRPFFVEGSQLLRGNGANYFYSRRIGAAPRGDASGDYVDRPNATTIISAAKLTGRMSSGLSVGALAALTAREFARTWDSTTATYGRTEIAPVTGYGVLRLAQQFGRNQSTVGVTMTGVQRDLIPGSPLAQLMVKQALTGGLDWNLRFANGYYQVTGFAGFSMIRGDSMAIAAQEASSRRYFQRPDQTYVHYDPNQTAMSGYTANLGIDKISGKHWLYGAYVGAESPGIELNDLGRIVTADGIVTGARITYRETVPGRLFRSYAVQLSTNGEWNYGWDRQYGVFELDATGTFKNQMTLSGTAFVQPRSQDERLTRGGPSMGTPWVAVGIVQLSSSFAARTQWRGRIYYERGEFDDKTYRLSGLLSFRPVPRWLISMTPNYLRSIYPRQYVMDTAGTAAATYGRHYVFAQVDQSQWSMQLRFNYAFTPDLTVEVYAEPFIASARFDRHGELPAPRSYQLTEYGRAPGTTIATDSTGARTATIGADTIHIANLDFNRTSFRSNVVVRWEWRRGSTLYLVWQQNRGVVRNGGGHVRLGDLFEGLSADGDNFLAVKVSYWFSAN